MEVKPGYKQTEVGVIPEDWEVKSFGEIGESLIGLTYKPIDIRSDGVLVLRSSNVQKGILRFDDNVFVEKDVPERIMVRPGDILICVRNGSRDLIGKCVQIDERARGMTFGAFMAVFRSPFHDFVHHQFQSRVIKRQIHEHLGATINQITNKSLNSFVIPLPPTKAEQEAIVAALSDVDALIAALDRLIAKKRDIKQAAMQELLTGKRRLLGFIGEWEIAEFGELTSPRKERIDPRLGGKPSLCIELEHIAPETGRLIGSTMTNELSSLKTVFYPEDVLFGKLRAYLRKYWIADRRGVCSTEIWVFCPSARILSEYLFQTIRTDQFIEAASTAYGTHMPRSDWNVVKHHKIPLPLPEEQSAIASILSDMDAEIAALEARSEKNRALKQGMMQELLTGRIRLA